MNTEALKNAGLTEGEIKVYLAILKLGSSSAGSIIRESGVAKSIAYNILEKLIEKGLVSYIIKNNIKYFDAGSPKRILDYVEEKEKELKETKKSVESLLPKLSELQSSKKSIATIYEGFKGMISVHEKLYETLKEGDEYYYLGILPEQPEHFHAYWEKDHKRRIKAGITCRLLFHSETPKETLKNRNSYKGCDARYMPLKIDTPAWFFGYKDTIVIGVPSSEILSFEIQNKEAAKSFYAYFEEFWKKSKPFKN